MRRIILLAVLLSGCVGTDIAMLVPDRYPPTTSVEVLFSPPERPYKQIAFFESGGPVNTSNAMLIEDMKLRAMEIGADAVVIATTETRRTPASLMYNPWLGGYQAVGGQDKPLMKAIAIKYQ